MPDTPTSLPPRPHANGSWLFVLLLIGGALGRLWLACSNFLNADEALHYLLSVQPTLARTYQATLSTIHPPLLVVLLHYWRFLGTSEWILRLPSVIAGTAFCWIMFLWLDRVTGRSVALIGLALFCFSPPLVCLSAEIRQYALLLLFAAASLYWLDLGIEQDSPVLMGISALALYLALLTNYASFLFALVMGLYGLARLLSARPSRMVVIKWTAGQLGGLALAIFLLTSHYSRMQARNAPQAIFSGYLRSSTFHPGQDHILSFLVKSNIRFFHYLFSQGAVGAVGLLLFILGIAWLWRDRAPVAERLPGSRQLALLFALPLLLNCAVALLGIFPYGGTRHNSYLSIFAVPAIAVGLGRWRPARARILAIAVAAVLLLCNVFPSPADEYIQRRNQKRTLMAAAIRALRGQPGGTTILTDDEGGLLLSYYLCPSRVVQIEWPYVPYLSSTCGNLRVIAMGPSVWMFNADNFPGALRLARSSQDAGSMGIVLFRAGSSVDKEAAFLAALPNFGCSRPQSYGQNILICPLEEVPQK